MADFLVSGGVTNALNSDIRSLLQGKTTLDEIHAKRHPAEVGGNNTDQDEGNDDDDDDDAMLGGFYMFDASDDP